MPTSSNKRNRGKFLGRKKPRAKTSTSFKKSKPRDVRVKFNSPKEAFLSSHKGIIDLLTHVDVIRDVAKEMETDPNMIVVLNNYNKDLGTTVQEQAKTLNEIEEKANTIFEEHLPELSDSNDDQGWLSGMPVIGKLDDILGVFQDGMSDYMWCVGKLLKLAAESQKELESNV